MPIGTPFHSRTSALSASQNWRTWSGYFVAGSYDVMHDYEYHAIRNSAGLVTPDGMPLVWLSRLNGWRNTNRVYGPDLMLEVCERSLATGYRHFFYGGQDGVPERLAERLQKRFP